MKLINIQEIQNRNQLYLSLFIMLMFTITLIVFKVYSTGEFLFVGIGINLLLAFIPFIISSVILFSSDKKLNSPLGIVALLLWLFTFPNAVYLITYFINLNPNLNFVLWFDRLIMLTISFNGLLLAFLSLYDIEKKLIETYSNWYSKIIMLFAILLASLGIYLGKFVNINGLDLLKTPNKIYNEVLKVLYRTDSFDILFFVLILTCFLSFAYFLFRGVANVSFFRNR